MATSTWPASLPQDFELGGDDSQRTTPVLRDDNSFGNIQTRRAGPVVVEEITRTFHVTETQYNTFEDFVEEHADRGARFVNVPISDAISSNTQARVKLLDYDAVKVRDDLYEITLTIEWTPRRLTKAQLDAIITQLFGSYTQSYSASYDRSSTPLP